MTLEEWVTMREPNPTNLFEWFEWCFQGHIFVYSGHLHYFKSHLHGHENAAEMGSIATTSYLTTAGRDWGADENGNEMSLADYWKDKPIAIEREQLVRWLHANRSCNPVEPILQVESIFVFDMCPGLPGYTTWFEEI